MSHKRYSLRGHLEEALKMTREMISKEHDSVRAVFVDSDEHIYPRNPAAGNVWIKDQIRLYVETWVLPEIEAALAKVRKQS